MDTAQFETLIRQFSGMAANTLGSKTVESALKRRLQACNLKDASEYLTRLRSSEAEMQALVDEVVVPETWFFRNREAFDALSREALTKSMQSDAPVRILSLPCSTGEEPYSMAMALFDVGVPAKMFHIDGVDICTQSVELARTTNYTSNSFRGKNLEFRDRYFTPQGKEYVLAEKVKRQVRFRQGNMLSPTFMPESGVYDFIFCRNVLIYFDHETQLKAVSVLARLLKKDGIIFVGPSESGVLMEHGFTSAQWPLTFAFVRKAAVEKPVVVPKPVAKLAPKPIKPIQNSSPKVAPVLGSRASPRLALTTAKPIEKPQDGAATAAAIAEISILADQGQLQEALQRCETLLRSSKPSAQLYYLTGLVHDTNKNIELAEQFYRKALYLEPSHYETIMHLAYLLETRGDSTSACNLRQRCKRMNAQQSG